MSLQDSIDRRRMAEPAAVACVAPPAQAPTLMLCTWQGERWALPWSQLEIAQFVGTEGHEQLLLCFAKYRVTIRGENLCDLWEDVVTFRLGCLRDLPAEYRAKLREGSPFISHIAVEILERTESESQP